MIFNGKALSAALAPLARVVERVNTIPILECVLIKPSPGGASFSATNMDIWSARECPADGTISALCLPARSLAAIAADAGERAVEIGDDDSGRVVVRVGRARFKLPTLSPADLPDVAGSFKPLGSFTVATDDFAAAIKRCGTAVSTEATRYYLNGIYFHGEGGSAVAVATDGHRLVRTSFALADGALPEHGFILPLNAAAQIVYLGSGTDAVTIQYSDSGVKARTECGEVFAKLIDGTFPDYQRVIPPPCKHEATVFSADLVAALKRVTLPTGGGDRVVLKGGGDGLTVSSDDATGATGEDVVDATCAGSPIVSLNQKYLREAITALGADEVTLSGDSAGHPWLITATGNEHTIAVVMPTRSART